MEDFYSVRDLPTEPMLTNSSLMCSLPLISQNDFLLAVASEKELKLFNLLDQVCAIELPEEPFSIAPYLFEAKQSIAVEFSSFFCVYYYENSALIEKARFNLLFPPKNEREHEIFEKYQQEQLSYDEAKAQLRQLAQTLSRQAQQFLSLKQQPNSDFFAPQKDRITAFATLDSSDNELQTLTGQCLVYCTESGLFQIVKSDLSGILLSLQINQQVAQVQTEGVIADIITREKQMQQFASIETSDQAQSWRATLLTQHGQILQIRNSQISQNMIAQRVPALFAFRQAKQIFAVHHVQFPSTLVRYSARGRAEMTYQLSHEYLSGEECEIELGKPFSGFLLLLQQGNLLFCNESGPAKEICLNKNVKDVKICRFSTSDEALIILNSDNKLEYMLIKKTANFAISNMEEKELQNLQLDGFDSEEFIPFSIEKERFLFEQFLPARAAARNVILEEMLRFSNKGTEIRKENNFEVQCNLEGAGPFTLVVTVKNISTELLKPMVCLVKGEILRGDEVAKIVPCLAENAEYELVFMMAINGEPSGEEISESSIEVAVGDDGERPLYFGIVHVPIFIF